MSADGGSFGINFWTKVAQHHKRFGKRCVHVVDTGAGGIFRNEKLVTCELVKANHLGAVEGQFVGSPLSLDDDDPAGAVVADGDRLAGCDGEFFCGEKLILVDATVDNPFICEALVGAATVNDRFKVVVSLEVGIDIARPIKLSTM